MKKLVLTFAMLGLCVLGGCGQKASQGPKSTDVDKIKTLKIGVMPSTDNMPLVIAHEQGIDQKHNVSIELATFKSARDRDAAFQAGSLEGINADLVGIATYLEGGMDLKITSATFGQFDLIGNDQVKSLADLVGQELVILKNQGPQYAAEALLKKAGFSGEDVQMIEVPQVPSRVELLNNHQAGAAILPEPFVTMSLAEGMHTLGSTREMGMNPFVLCFTKEVIESKAEALKGMYAAYNEAVDWMKEHDQAEYIQLFIDAVGFPEALADKIVVPDYPYASQVTEKDILEAFDWAKEHQLFTQRVTPKDVLSDVYFK